MARHAFSNDDIDSIEDVLIIGVNDTDTRLVLTFLVGTANLTAFKVDFRAHELGDWATLASAAADYTSPEGYVIGASGDLTVAASGSTVHFLVLDVGGLQGVRIQAAGTSSTMTGHYSIS